MGDRCIMLLDSVGWLARCYRFAELAYVGGGYGPGVHNLLEPAAFGCPSFFGPKHSAYPEAEDLIRRGASFRAEEVDAAFLAGFLKDPERRASASRAALLYLEEEKGASLRELELIERLSPLRKTPRE
jgi:3-deoxy-D-manno-octulosonic-acid transferase